MTAKTLAEASEGREEKLDFIRASMIIMELTMNIAKLVRGWGLSDSIIIATARRENAKVVTGDEHFADLKDEVILI